MFGFISALVALLVACLAAEGHPAPEQPPPAPPNSTYLVPTQPAAPIPVAGPSAAVNPNAARLAFDRMTEAQRVGQLFMVGTPAAGLSSQTVTDIQAYHAGNIILTGRSSAGVAATAALTASLQGQGDRTATSGVPLFISTDQEGGQVQVLSGPGFATIPSGLVQGGYATSDAACRCPNLGQPAQGSRRERRPRTGPRHRPERGVRTWNKPIGYYQREYGHDPTTVSTKGGAFARAWPRPASTPPSSTSLAWAGSPRTPTPAPASPTPQTTRTDAYLAPVRQRGAPPACRCLMMSTAYYAKHRPGQPGGVLARPSSPAWCAATSASPA